MKLPRASGILLHPTSFPNRYGIGDFGPEAYRFVDWLVQGGQRFWQVLPLGPTGYGDSPYQAFSAFAGNPLLISLDRLAEEGLLVAEDLPYLPDFPAGSVDYGWVIPWKLDMLGKAWNRFRQGSALQADFDRFCQAEADWLTDYARFMALKDQNGGKVWSEWEPTIARREPDALARADRELEGGIGYYRFLQFTFYRHYGSVRRYANERGVRIIGDLPIFVAYDSADTWANPDKFYLDAEGKPTVVAGVPPDYFSETGQLWGNPLYRWDRMKADGYGWWIARMRQAMVLYDVVRIDHFRGFEAYWEVPASEATAINGRWVPGPGADVFHALRHALGDLPIIAEDLGVITPEVEELRDSFGLPGMKILQFAFGSGADNAYLPHNYERNCVVYTGTHDNDTTRGWFEQATEAERQHVQEYLGSSAQDVTWDLIRLALMSVANLAVVPMQDLLDLGSEARMNTPGQAAGNWSWRYPEGSLRPELAGRLGHLAKLYSRDVNK